MKVSESFYQLKNETAQLVLALQDPARLERVRKVLEADEPTPQAILDAIAQGRAESKAGLGTPIEDFLEEMENW
jgi:hypothetical protein